MTLKISIHSLVKRETADGGRGQQGQRYFNPLPRKEGDWQGNISGRHAIYFNPLPRKEGDRAS